MDLVNKIHPYPSKRRTVAGEQVNLNHLPAYCRARVLILGVGNLLFGDDGFGPAVAEYLHTHYAPSDDVCIMDAGTGVRKLLFTLSLSDTYPDEIVIVDAVDWGDEIGKLAEIKAESLPPTKIDDFSLHQVPTSNMLRELQEHHGIEVTVITCDVGDIPQVIMPGLSPPIQNAVYMASQKIAERFSLEVIGQNQPGKTLFSPGDST
jgi:coenzyme F420 hydrogenase subunit delta